MSSCTTGDQAHSMLHWLHAEVRSGCAVCVLIMFASWVQGLFGHHDEDESLDREATEQLNFGGGFLTEKAGTADTAEDDDRHRTKKEV